ncbi:hypothetical protein VNO77_25730 [Canavalia gladiata]|uniref:Uncharacterized protein n=1 Tax=Canavalia gladiata TaxID=3824 RepID=A0AAN9KSI0_CANGL
MTYDSSTFVLELMYLQIDMILIQGGSLYSPSLRSSWAYGVVSGLDASSYDHKGIQFDQSIQLRTMTEEKSGGCPLLFFSSLQFSIHL